MLKYTYATGRRKAASARVFLWPASRESSASPSLDEQGVEVPVSPTYSVNGVSMEDYFPSETLRVRVGLPFEVADRICAYNVKATVSGGGVSGQASALRHGLARAIERAEPSLRPLLKKAGLLRRDPRVVERKKAGRHKARKKPQFSKR